MKLPRRWPAIRRALLGMTDLERRALTAWIARYVNPQSGQLRVARPRFDEDDGGAEIPAVSLPTGSLTDNRAR